GRAPLQDYRLPRPRHLQRRPPPPRPRRPGQAAVRAARPSTRSQCSLAQDEGVCVGGTLNAPHPEQAKRVEGRTAMSRNPDGYIYVYILRCADDSYYVGLTRDSLEARVSRHDTGHFGGYTANRRPVVLVWQQDFQRLTDAIAAERRIKGWSRAKKEALIKGDFDLLHLLSQQYSTRIRS